MKTAKKGFFSELAKDLKKHRYLYIMLIPVILYFLLFSYLQQFLFLIFATDLL